MNTARVTWMRAARKTVKWGGLVVTVLLLVVWTGSCWWNAGWRIQNGDTFAVSAGQFRFYGLGPLGGPEPYRTVGIERRPFGHTWKIEWGEWGFGPFLAIPLWLPILLSLLATAATWRADSQYLRRSRTGLCPSCGYDRAGLAAGVVCPECGSASEGGGAAPHSGQAAPPGSPARS